MKFPTYFSMSALIAGSILLSACSSQSVADSETKKDENMLVSINWHEPENYQDVRAPNGGQHQYQENIFYQLDKHFQKTAKKFLPEGYTLKLKVTDLNLAGDARFHQMGHQNIRLVKSIYFPSMEFEFELFQDGKLVKSDTVKIKDMAFMERGGLNRFSESLQYEKRLIKDWFDDELSAVVTQWQRHLTAEMS
ncbi:MAG: DUF3016 domain-containing protein [Gammaproteobacteria bacterium]|nr:DUF3016 domain-containing protein [Gammaproteobacteria bacterium]